MLRNGINLAFVIWRFIMVLNKTAVRRLFHKENMQINILALNYIDEWVYDAVTEMIENAKVEGVVRIKPESVKGICPSLIWEPNID